MTSDKSSPSKKTPVQRREKYDAATLQNMAHDREHVVEPAKKEAEYESAASMIERLSPSNLSLVENIIRVVLKIGRASCRERVF